MHRVPVERASDLDTAVLHDHPPHDAGLIGHGAAERPLRLARGAGCRRSGAHASEMRRVVVHGPFPSSVAGDSCATKLSPTAGVEVLGVEPPDAAPLPPPTLHPASTPTNMTPIATLRHIPFLLRAGDDGLPASRTVGTRLPVVVAVGIDGTRAAKSERDHDPTPC
jgi:hypothetical protein